jgi:hypothetical protein
MKNDAQNRFLSRHASVESLRNQIKDNIFFVRSLKLAHTLGNKKL